MAQYPASFALSGLNPTTGYVFRPGADGTYYGVSIAAAGDVNGDGQTDYLIGESDYHPRSLVAQTPALAGQTHLIFGGAANLAAMDLLDGVTDGIIDQSLVTPTYGYKLKYNVVGDGSGVSVEGAGQVDGVAGDDIIIGTPRSTAVPGSAHFVSGGTNLAVLDAADGSADGQIDLTNVDGSTGYEFVGTSNSDRNGYAVGSVGDVNNDGFRDLLIGSYQGDPPGANNGGIVALVFGSPTNLAQLDTAGGSPDDGVISIANLNGLNGYRFAGATNDLAGVSLAGVKDINGDGVADLIIGAQQSALGGESYLVYGGAANLAALDTAGGAAADGLISLGALNGTTGYKFKTTDDDQFGWAVSGAGDVNADGFEDLLIGDPFGDTISFNGGHAYLIFGGTANLSALDTADGTVDGSITADLVNGTTGFRLGGSGSQWVGHSVAAAGDVNGDGYDDVSIGANFRAPARTGAAYIMFGGPAGSSGFAVEDAADGLADGKINLTSFSGVGGMRIDGVATGDQAGFDVAAAGDINGDGLVEMMLSSVRDQGAITQQDTGEVYIVYSRLPDAAVNRTGTGIAQTLVGGNFNDVLSGLGGNDSLISGGGNDTLYGGAENDALYGAAGLDTLYGGLGADLMFGGPGADMDTFHGDGDSDTVSYAASGSSVTVNLSAGVGSGGDAAGDRYSTVEDAIGSNSGDFLAGAGGANVFEGRNGNDKLFGGLDGDSLFGGAGIDTMMGGSGADFMAGGADTDYYFVDNVGDAIDETTAGSGGTDTVNVSINDYFVGDGVERINVSLAALTVTGGDATNNQMYGGTGGDRLDGGGGNDQVTGNNGIDVLLGGAGNDALFGGIDGDSLFGGAGNDTMTGGAGADFMAGGADSDFYFVDNAADAIDETTAGSGGADTVNVSVNDYFVADEVERINVSLAALTVTGGDATDNLMYGGTGGDRLDGGGGNDQLTGNNGINVLLGGLGNDKLFGGSVADSLFGGAGNDTMMGGAGADFMAGGADADFYFVDNAGDSIDETTAGSSGADTVNVSVNNYFVGDGAERIVVSLGALTVTGGDSTDNLMFGGTGGDGLNGGGGNDQLNGNNGADRLFGGLGNDKLFGGNDGDSLFGGGGIDTMTGGAGADLMAGGADTDYYFVDNVGDLIDETTAGSGGTDTVNVSVNDYFVGDGGERINVSLASGLTVTGGDATDNQMYGGTGGDRLNGGGGNDSLTGGDGLDLLFGGLGNDKLFGGIGDDTLDGGDGIDSLVGGAGADNLEGGVGDDRFLKSTGEGDDTIADFGTGLDKVDLIGITVTSGFGSAVVTLSDGSQITAANNHFWQAADFI